MAGREATNGISLDAPLKHVAPGMLLIERIDHLLAIVNWELVDLVGSDPLGTIVTPPFRCIALDFAWSRTPMID